MFGVSVVAMVVTVVWVVVVALNPTNLTGALNFTGGDETGVSAAATEFPPYAHIIGDANAPVTVVEYGDFQ